MSKTNVQVVRDYIEEINNHKKFDQVFNYCDQNCVIHMPPYVGLGLKTDDSSGDRIILTGVAPNGPAAGHLQIGDELVRVTDAEKTWETFDELKNGLWGQGISGTSLTITVRRNHRVIDIHLERGLVNTFNMRLASVIESWQKDVMKTMPDLNVEIKAILEQDNLVACYMVNRGTSREYHHSAVWSEMDLFRMKNEKIIEIWSVEDRFALMHQLGYKTIEPVKEPA